MKTPEQLEEMFGVTSEQIKQWDIDASNGILPGEAAGPVEYGPGRPLMFDEEMKQVGFKEPPRVIALIDARAAELGMKRSEYLRHLVAEDLKQAGIA